MGKRKDDQFADNADGVTPRKHKKHKKKHKHRRSEAEQGEGLTSPKTSFKLKLKIGGETLGTKNVPSMEHTASHSSFDDALDDPIINVTDDLSRDSMTLTPVEDTTLTQEEEDKVKEKVKEKGVSEEDDEKKWLDALEAGTLDDYGEIPKTKDPALLTTRQRALLHGHQVELQQLPSGYKTVELTEEQKQRRQQRAKKRRQQAHEKREKDKKQTLDRLLKKQETKAKGSKGKGKRSNVPRLRYLINSSGFSLSLPQGQQYPLPAQVALAPKAVVQCGVEGCTNPKKYACSKTQVPLCSLQCFQKNQRLAQSLGTWPVAAT